MDEIELIEKRKPREKHFLQKDGTILAKIYDSDIHYLKNGKYEEIDNTLEKRKNIYRNKKNDYRVTFKSNGKNSLVKMAKGKFYIDLKLKYANDSEILKKHTKSKIFKDILYTNIYDGVDIEYQTLSNKIKETLILKNDNYSEFTFVVDTNLDLVQEDDLIIAKNDEMVIFTIDKPFMEDASGMRCTNVNYKLLLVDDKYQIKVILDKNWLSREDVVYPVYVDPTITNESQNITLTDTYIYPGDSNDDRNSKAYLKAGFKKVNGTVRENRSLIKFSLPEIGTGSEIIDAQLELIPFVSNNNNKNARNYLLSVHQVTKDWDEKTAKWEDMHDKYNTKVEALMECERSYLENPDIYTPTLVTRLFGANITKLVKKWYKDTPNYGVMLKAVEEGYIDDDFPAFFSKDNKVEMGNPKPMVYITYRNQNGLESYYDYMKQSFSTGATFVNTFNGNLTSIFDIGRTIGGNFPANLNLVYNTNDVILNNSTFFGSGYKLNLEQTVKEVSINDNPYLEYLDEDGTLHYFYKDSESSIYIDEDNNNLVIEKTDDNFIMKDSAGGKQTFFKNGDKYFLEKIENSENNFINIYYDESLRVNKIKDNFDSEILISYADNLITITSSDEVCKINFINNRISSLENNSGTVEFNYNDSNLLSEVVDTTGMKVTYEYYEKSPYKIKKVAQYGLNNSLGQYFTLKYGFNTTNVIDNKGCTETLIYNDNGNLLSRNSLKGENDIKGAYSLVSTYGNEEKNKNKLISESIPVTHIKNYLKNVSFEDNNNYFIVSDSERIFTSFSSDRSNSGQRCFKIKNTHGGNSINQTIKVPKGKYYTFSGYFLNYDPIRVILSYIGKNGTYVNKESELEVSGDFNREDLTIFYEEEAQSDLILTICLDSIGTVYLDDIQLEEGEVANSFNIIENSDFSNGLADWTLEAFDYNGDNVNSSKYFEVVDINEEKDKAVKISMNPLYTTRMVKRFPISGKKDDLYTVSFWYKNEGVANCRQFADNSVTIFFHPVDNEIEYCILSSETFNPNDNVWQYFSYRARALEDFDYVEVIFNQNTQANNLYLTNISLYKNVTSGDYKYDDNGNLISIEDQSKNNSFFKFDSKNQLVQSIDPKGSIFKYEYDNNETNKILSAISSSGISNEIKYNSIGKPISTKIIHKYNEEITDNFYRIRSKGSEKYIKANLKNIILEESKCSNTLFNIKKQNESYKIFYSVIPNYSVSYNEDKLVLSESDSNNLFEFEKNDNGSYYIKVKNCKENAKCYLKANNNSLELSYFTKDPSFEFYIEIIEDSFIENSTTYSEDGRFITSTISSDFSKTIYNYNHQNGMLNYIIDPNNRKTEYNYNKNRLNSIRFGDIIIFYDFNENNLLSKLSFGKKEYNLIYDNFLNLKHTSINDKIALASNTYDLNGDKLLTTTYGNNQKISYDYDEFQRLKSLKLMDVVFDYKYDNNGNISKVLSNNNIEKYHYDINNRLCEYKLNNFDVKYTYDSNNFVAKKKFKKDNFLHNVYNYFDNNLVKITEFDNTTINYNYDGLSRLINKKLGSCFNINYSYLSKGKRTTNLIKEIKNEDDTYEYRYDSMNNITEIYYNNSIISKYFYDDYNTLTKEIDFIRRIKIEYEYDDCGNLIEENVTNIDSNELIKTNNFLYQNDFWEDQLSQFNDKNILYDQIGNMVSVGDEVSMTWINGRSLKSYFDSTKNINTSYKYNVDGIRNSKIVNGVETKYYLEGNNIIYEETGEQIIYYLYDSTGIIGLNYNNENYYYLKNLQGDIIGILNNNFDRIVSYSYDSWGNLLSICDSNNNKIIDKNNIGYLNHFRYRGYYYDDESGYYYLNSRYYNPVFKRFISADKYLSTDTGLFGYNMYIYANNNPINNIDVNGNFAHIGVIAGIALVGTIVIGALYANSKKQNEKAKKEIEKVQKKKKEAQKNNNDAKRFEKTLKENAKTVKDETDNMNSVQKISYFIDNVKTGGQYDLKNTGEWDKDIYFEGRVMESQDIGNYHFGYIGRALGYDIEFLQFGAGLYQVKSGTSKLAYCFTPAFCDDPRDSYYIRLGAIAYDETNK